MPGRTCAPSFCPQVLGHGLRAALREIEQQLASLAKDPTQQAWHGEPKAFKPSVAQSIVRRIEPASRRGAVARRPEALLPTRRER